MRAVIQTAPGVSSVQTIPIPPVVPGSALVNLSASLVHANLQNVYHATLPLFELPYPVVPGAFGIGYIASLGPDATTLKTGQLVMVTSFIRARDDPSVHVIRGVTAGSGPESQPRQQRLYNSLVRNGSGMYAEYVLAPLETIFALDEQRLLSPSPSPSPRLGYAIPNLLVLGANAIIHAGLRSIALQPGERVIVTPATGHYSTAAVDVAVALGARVVAFSRNASGLAKLKNTYPDSVETVQITGDVAADSKALSAFGVVDAVVEVSPPVATGSKNLETAVSVLREKGRVSLMGGRADQTLPISYAEATFKGWTIKGSWMYEREDVERVVRLAETGLLKLGKSAGHEIMGAYGLDQLTEAIDKSVDMAGPGCIVYIKP
ncbi:alcohol dehydrogenase [Xylariaceae sp. AK1471]|nr:alcohol dehydrogenase [Xylariaceae sp. AK1471]